MAFKEVPRQIGLADYIGLHLDTPFAWGTHDCVTFVLGWVYHHTGVNFKNRLGSWNDEASATSAVVAAGGIKACCDEFFKPINPMYAQNGDIALIGRTVFLFSGPHIVGPGVTGLVFEDRMRTRCAWSY